MKNPILKSFLMILTSVMLGGVGLSQRQMENLSRGVVAVKKSTTQIYVSWRLFGNDPAGIAFNVYRSANSGPAGKINGATPLTATTDYTDTPASLSTTAYSYFVRPVVGGVEQADSETSTVIATTGGSKQYLSVPLRTDTGPNGPYDVKFCWVGDLDGDGDFDYVVDRLSTLGENEQFLEAYTNTGTFLWRMAMGPNSVNQYAYEPGSSAISIGDTDNVTVYDMDGDGKAEVLVRTANGVTVTNAAGIPVTTITDASNTNQFLSVINGLTGAELGRATMPNAWAVHGTLTNKAMIAYLDGKRPSVVMYGYNRADSGTFYRQFTAFDFRDGALTQRWTLPQTFAGSEGHQIRIADVDNDGKDEICDLGHVIDDDGTQLFNVPLLSHGDRFHIADIDPDRPGLETYAIQQYNPTSLATALFGAGSGTMIKKWYSNSPTDVGRGIALDLTSAHKGYEMYSTQAGIFNAKGAQIYTNNLWAPEGLWWDGDLAREFIDGAGSGALNPVINKFNPVSGSADRLWTLYNDNGNYSTRQAYGGRPAFWGDILGDWREELVLVASDYSELRVYTTAIAAANRLYTLMHNPQYRCQTTTKGYVQASYVDYYLGYNMPSVVPPPAMISSTLTWALGTTWDSGVSPAWKNAAGVATTYTQGDSVLFDVSGSNASSVALSGSLAPAAVSFFNPQEFTLDGSAGNLSGGMTFSKSGAGKTTLTGSHSYTGTTTIWDGALVVNGQLSNSPVTVWGGIWGGSLASGETGGRLAGSGTVSQPVSLQYRGAITPGSGMGNAATLTLGASLTAVDGSVLALDLSDDPTGSTKPNDRINVAGNLVLSGTVAVCINALDSNLAPGTYTLLTYGGTLSGSLSNLAVTVPDGTPYTLAAGSGAITLTIPFTRAPGAVVWRGTAYTWDLAASNNWLIGGTPSVFVSGDSVTFDDTGIENSQVSLAVALPVSGMIVSSSGEYSFNGTGAIAGSGGLLKSGTGTLTLSNTNTYTGPTTITGGILEVDNLNDGGSPSSIGAAGSAASNLVLNGGTLNLIGLQTNTNRSLTLGAGGGTLSIPSASASLQISGSLTGTGSLTKSGSGTLVLAASNNYTGGTFINGGSISLASDSVNVSGLGSGVVTLNGGTLSMTNSTGDANSPNSPWPLNVPTGFSGRLNADGRCTLSGALTGGGDFTFYTPFIRTDLTGNWSAFTGRIFVISDADGGDFRIKNTAGYAGAQLDLGSGVYAFYNNTGSSMTLQIGALSGVSTSYLSSGLSSGATITWQIGGRNQDTTFAGVISNHTGPSALTKVGSGTLVLSGANTYTGATLVSAGRLRIDGSTSGTNHTVLNGATLGGSGTITGNVTIQTGGALEHGVSGATPLAIAGNLSFAANAVIRPAAGIALEAGTYTVLTYTGTLTGTPVLAWEAPPGSSLTASFSTATPGVITMTLASPVRGPGAITWTGATSSNWDSATVNWTIGAQSVSFLTDDAVSFTDSGNAASAINLAAEVLPASVAVNSLQNYTFSGTGRIGGTATLVKSGSGVLTITGIYTTSGAMTISGGVLSVTQTGSGGGAVGAVVGTGPITLSGGGEFRLGSTNGKNFPGNPIAVSPVSSGVLSSVSLSNGSGSLLTGAADSTLTISGPFSFTSSGVSQFAGFDGTVIVPSGSQLRFSSTSGPNGNGGANTIFQIDGLMNTRNAGGTNGVVLGALTGGGTIQGQSNTAAGTVVYHIGARNLDTTFSGVFANGSNGTAAINKLGAGTLTLSGASTHTGATTVTAGKLSVTGSLAATTVTVATTGTLGGTGSIAGAVSCNGALAPGITAGTLTLSAGLTLASTSSLDFDLGSLSDRVAVTGNLTLNGTVNVTAAAGIAAGTYTLATYTGALTNNTLDVGTLPAGYAATVSTATAGQVRLVVTSLNTAPQITVAAAASQSNVTTTTTDLSVTATDDAGEGNLTYTWSATGPASVGFSPNGTHSAKNATASFSAPGSYTLTVTVSDVPGLTVVSSTSVTVIASTASLTVDPPFATLEVGGNQVLAASALDQFGNPVAASVSWSATGGGEISQSGLYTATAAGGPWQAIATAGSVGASAAITVTSRTFEAWVAATFTELQINAGESAMTADPDKDGLTNLAEYALGGQPYAFTSQPAVSSDATSMSITFQRPAWIGDVIYQAEACADFTAWNALTLEVLNPGADPETVRAIYTLPVPKPGKSFVRLRFEK